MLVISEEKYKIKVGIEVFEVEYPSFEEAQAIAKEYKKLQGDGEKSIKVMKDWLVKLGLDEKFFSMKAVKSNHILTIWQEINGVKK